MKRTLAISMWLAMSVAALAQTPTVVEKPAQKTATAKATTKSVAVNSKPSPATTAKAVAATPSAAKVAVKPAAVPAQPVAAKTAAVPAAKTVAVSNVKASTTGTVKPVAASTAKANVAPAAQVKTAAAVKTSAPAPVVKASAAPVKAASVAPVKAPTPVANAKPAPVTSKVVAAAANKTEVKAPESKQKDPFSGQKTVAVAKPVTGTAVAVNSPKPAEEEKKAETKKVSMSSRRDPFLSPVVKMGAVGSGCSSGKRCLTIDQIAVRGVVRSDTGMIAVVVNAMDKAYFLRENDPVFNGYVVKITGDSVVFKETFRDRLGKTMTRDITKTISRPAA